MAIFYYDGNCVYCYNYAIWLIQKGLSHKYEFATLKGKYGQQLFKQHPEAKNRNSVIVVDGDHIEYESTAIASLITSLPNQYKFLGLLLYVVPKSIRNFGYQLFANNRDKMWHTHWHHPNAYEKSFFLDDNEHVNLTDSQL